MIKSFPLAFFMLMLAIMVSTVIHTAQAESKLLTQSKRPVIGVSGSSEDSRSVQFILARLHAAGAESVFLDHARIEHIDEDIAHLDGVIIGGNRWDINPQDYGEAPDERTDNEDDFSITQSTAPSLRGAYEDALLHAVFAQKVPFLGICSGMQRLNIHQHEKDGGKLTQHVDGQQQYRPDDSFNPAQPSDTISIKPHTRLHALAERTYEGTLEQAPMKLEENSLHHQVVDPNHIRRGFVPAATSIVDNRNTIEAIEPDPNGPYADLPILGVQWHPEYGVSTLSETLFSELVAQAKQRMNRTEDNQKARQTMDTLSPEIRALILQGPKHLHSVTGFTR